MYANNNLSLHCKISVQIFYVHFIVKLKLVTIMKVLKVSEASFVSGGMISISTLIDFLKNAVRDGAEDVQLIPNMTTDDDGDYDGVKDIDVLTFKSVPLTEEELEALRIIEKTWADGAYLAKVLSLEAKIKNQAIGMEYFSSNKNLFEEELKQLKASKK